MTRQTFLVLVITCTLSGVLIAHEGSSQKYLRDYQVTLHKENASLTEVLNGIEKQTDFKFSYQHCLDEDLSLSIHANKQRLDHVLKQIAGQTHVSFKRINEMIAVSIPLEAGDKQLEEVDIVVEKRVITGTVTDEIGLPLIGATIVIKGTTKGTKGAITDNDGKYSLSVPDDATTLIFSYVGFKAVEVEIGNRNVVDISLKTDATALQEVEVKADNYSSGYQSISREKSTADYAVVDREMLDKQPLTDLSTALVGTVAGLRTRQNLDGSVNDAGLKIRGQGTLSGLTSMPLVIVDGYPVEFTNGFSTINPNDVESVTVLKDAAATAIWGSRAANGVIVVTTKMPKGINKLKVRVDHFTQVSNKIDLQQQFGTANSAQLIDFQRRAYENELWNQPYTPDPFAGNALDLSQALIWDHYHNNISTQQMNAGLDSLAQINNHGQLRDHLLRNAMTQQYNISVSGSQEHMAHHFSFMYEKNQGEVIKDGYNKYNLGMRNKFMPTKNIDFTINTNVSYLNQDISGPHFFEMKALSPYENLVNPDGSYAVNVHKFNIQQQNQLPLDQFPYSDWSYNLLREVRERERNRESLAVRLNGDVNIRLLKGVDLQASGSYTRSIINYSQYYNEETFFVRDYVNEYVEYNQATRTVTKQFVPKGGIKDNSVRTRESWYLRGNLNVNRQIAPDLEVNAVAGGEIAVNSSSQLTSPTMFGFVPELPSSSFLDYGYGSSKSKIKDYQGRTTTIRGQRNYSFDWKKLNYVSYYSTANFTYKSRYNLSGSVRSDASNTITHDPKLRWSPLWHVGASWNIRSEPFMSRVSFVNSLKLRFTYGSAGRTVTGATRPLARSASELNRHSGLLTTDIDAFGNPALRWERSNTTNLGLEMGLFGKLFANITYYSKHDKGIVTDAALPEALGVATAEFNDAEILNRGGELTLTAPQPIKIGKLQWQPRLVYAYNHNRVLRLTKSRVPAIARNRVLGRNHEEGNPLWAVYSYEYLGMEDGIPYVKGEEGQPHPMSSNVLQSKEDSFLIYQGTQVNPHTLGLGSSFRAHGFELFVQMSGEFGGVFRKPVFNYGSAILPGTRKMSMDQSVESVLANDPRVPSLPESLDGSPVNWGVYTRYLNTMVASASYIEINAINLSYTLPQKLIQSTQLSRVRAYFNMGRVGVIWRGNKQGYDPRWLPGSQMPVRNYAIGINAAF